MAKIKPWSEETERLLSTMPQAGETHLWFARVASRLANVLDKDDTTHILLTCASWVTHRRIPDREIHDAVAFGYGEVQPTNSKKYVWPEPKPSLIGEVLGEADPICDHTQSTGLRPDEVLMHLFPAYSIICISMNEFKAESYVWPDDLTEIDLSVHQYIVPNPLVELTGTNQQGQPSVRCQSNILERRFVVVEFDTEPDKVNQARLLGFLSESIPCVMVVDSAGKSLHGWYPVYNLTESQAAAFFGKAVALGADQSVYDKCKLVRMPGGLRDGARRQRIVYYDEEALP
jgi:hypothetical protein